MAILGSLEFLKDVLRLLNSLIVGRSIDFDQGIEVDELLSILCEHTKDKCVAAEEMNTCSENRTPSNFCYIFCCPFQTHSENVILEREYYLHASSSSSTFP